VGLVSLLGSANAFVILPYFCWLKRGVFPCFAGQNPILPLSVELNNVLTRLSPHLPRSVLLLLPSQRQWGSARQLPGPPSVRIDALNLLNQTPQLSAHHQETANSSSPKLPRQSTRTHNQSHPARSFTLFRLSLPLASSPTVEN
jgi:hypothetical protein